ncbi:MAG: sugar MFS transporter [Halarsenatibacteraceae bacterium]
MEGLEKKDVIALFIANSFLFFFQGITKYIYVPLVTPIESSFEVGSTEAGLLITLVYLGYALARFPSGILADIFGCPRVIAGTGLLMSVSLLLVGISPNFYAMAAFSFLMGASTGLYVTAGYSYSVILGQDRFETVSTALLETFGGISGLVAPLFVILIWETLGLPISVFFYIMAAGALLASVIFIWLAKKNNLLAAESRKQGGASGESASVADIWPKVKGAVAILKEPAINRFIIWATLVGGFGAFAIKGFESFIPSFLHNLGGYSFSNANQLFTILAISGLITKMAVAWAADKFGSKRILFVFYIFNFTLFFYLTTAPEHFGIIATLILFGITFKSHNTVINSYVLKVMPKEYQGTGFGLFSTLYTAIYSAGAVFTGFVADQAGSLVIGMRAAVIGVVIAFACLALFKVFVKVDELKSAGGRP